MAETVDPLTLSPQLATKLADVVHIAMHQGGPVASMALDPEVVAWAKAMRDLGLMVTASPPSEH